MEATELELKFEVPDEKLPQLSEQLASAAALQTSRLRSTYFDTPGRDLRSARLGLRVRDSEEGLVQNLKSERHFARFARLEWETAIASERPDPEALADTPAGDLLDGKGGLLEPVFTTSVDRTRRVWTSGEDMVEVSLDRGEITSGTRREPIQELELELKAGDPEAVFALAETLTRRVKLPLLFQSKAERGYRLADEPGWHPERAEAIFIAPQTPAGDAFREIARSCLAQVANNARLVSHYRSLEALHQLRVGLRRFRASLTMFRPFIEDAGFGHVDSDTKWLAGELDPARDLDVFIHESFRRARLETTDRAAFARLGIALIHAQTRAYKRALTALASARFAKLMLSATRWMEIGAWTRSQEPIIAAMRDRPVDAFARKRLDRMRRQVKRRGRHLERLDAQGRHQLRIRAKKLRYGAKFFSHSFGRPGRQKRFLEALADLQASLGRLHDAALSPHLALALAREASPEAGFAAGLIIARKRASAARDERAALEAFARFDMAKPFWK